ncbi:MAG: LytS/YhcK type 5TM receptor domain-containing protein [Roseobacter sp.]
MVLVLQILENIVLLMLLGVGFYVIESAKGAINSIYRPVLHGISFGLIAFLVTSTPVSMGDGATLDARAGPVVLAGVVAGPVSALIAAMLGGLARGLVGGSFAFSGVVVYLVYAAIGTVVWTLLPKSRLSVVSARVIASVCILSCCGAALMYFLIDPPERAIAWVQQDLPWIMVANVM